ncbi:hypothetical protein EXE43_17140, partial [Halorubrum sp. SS5]
PTRLGRREVPLRCCGAGLKGAAARAKPDDASTAGSVATEERSESREPSRLGLWRSPSPRDREK